MRQVLLPVFAVFCVMSGHANADDSEHPPLSWLSAPSPTEEDFPYFAQVMSISGMAKVVCILNADGFARECVATASPTGLGFETAAIAIAKRGQIKSNIEGVTPEDKTFSFYVPFSTPYSPSSSPAESWDGDEPTAKAWIAAKMYVDQAYSQHGTDENEDVIPKALEKNLTNDFSTERAAFVRSLYSRYGLSLTEQKNVHVSAFARLFTLYDLDGSRVPASDIELEANLMAAEGGHGPLSSIWRIRNAYCERYECELVTPEDPVTPEDWCPPDDEVVEPNQTVD